MIDESPDTRRTFVESLATESGLRKVRQIVETPFAMTYSVLKPMFDPHCILFLRLVSHNELLSSLILEKAVGTIYNVIYGPGGRRAVGFFTRMTDFLAQIKTDGRHQNSVQFGAARSEVLSLVSRVLLSTLTLNHEAAIQVDLRSIAGRIYDCCHADNADAGAGDDSLQRAYEDILKIRDILSMGDSIPITQKPDELQTIRTNQKGSTRHIVDLPGELSELGPRHDNDKSAISDIQILPTKSEILNDDRPEFLPARCATDSSIMHHERGIRRLLDSQFRLLREDTSGVLREGIRLIIHTWKLIVHGTDWRLKRKFLRDNMPTPVRVYSGVEIRQIKSEHFRGIEVDLEFDQLPRLKKVSPAKRKQWWVDSKALRKGSNLLALLDAEDVDDTSAIYFLVSKRETSYIEKVKQGSAPADRVNDVVSDGNRAMVTLGLVGPPNSQDLEKLVLFSRSNPFPRPLILVEFPAIPYNSFEGILRCLQVLHQNPARMPFTAWLAPSTDNHEMCESLTEGSTDAGNISIQPPAYFRNNLLLDLSCLRDQGDAEDASQILSMSLSHDPKILSADLSRVTALDEGQANALIWALRRKIALIQGPPGTGKSYVGLQLARCLLYNKDMLNLGPILCVCYTAHALDQFLDGLLKSGVTNIIRIGPRSASPHIESLSLETRKQEPGPRIKGLPRIKNESRVKLLSISSRIDELLKQAQSGCHSLVLGVLKKRFPSHSNRIISGSPGQTDTNALQAWVSGDAPGDWSDANIVRSIDRLLQEDVWTLTASERTRLLSYWQEAALTEISQQVLTLLEAHSAEKERYTSAFNMSDVQRLNDCQVVGVTTTQLANNADLLRNLDAKVLICEEAAEVLESHVLTALIPSIQHAILIGDHLQLRPRISNLRLSMDYERESPKYNLDESLFERLANFRFGESTSIEGGQNQQQYSFPVMQLSHQRRMHPSISELVRETLYPKLQDHPTMASYPLVPGIAHRLCWLDHPHLEDPTDPTEPMQSKTNTWEIGMVTALVRHLCQQGKYGPGEIAVLTPYVGQLRMLRNVLEKQMTLIISETDSEVLDETEGLEVSGTSTAHGKWCGKQRAPQKGSLLDVVRLATVDNFQGEEASVVIVSLVRSNRSRNCGFLKMPNRINVLLRQVLYRDGTHCMNADLVSSRAKHGMYIIGNASTASTAPMWSSVIQLLEKGANIGRRLELRCDRHPSQGFYVSCPNDFTIHSPEGGCAEKCRLRLDCGHTCAVKCHSERQHKAVKCMELCTRMKDCGHACPKKCHEQCGGCLQVVHNVLLPCGHLAEAVECRQMGNLAKVRCTKRVSRTMDRCGHSVEIRCFENDGAVNCFHLCDSPLSCGHTCRRLCWQCRYTDGDSYHIDHGPCRNPCGRGFSACSHSCGQPCHQGTLCPPCNLTCEVRCRHSRCAKTCSEPCPPCAETCGWGCEHREQCSMPCAVPCNNIPCDLRCKKKITSCGHQCPGICGERCPDPRFCRLCCGPEILEQNVDLIELKAYKDVDIDQDPLVFLSCGHFYTASSLDGIMGMSEHYEMESSTGRLLGPKLTHRLLESGRPKGCPQCRAPLRDIDRYNRIIKRAFLDEATKKFATHASLKFSHLLEEVEVCEKDIEREKSGFVSEWLQDSVGTRSADEVKRSVEAYRGRGNRLLGKIKEFTKSVAKSEQPFGRVSDILASASARKASMPETPFHYSESYIQTGFQSRGHVLALRLTWALFWNFDTIYSNKRIDPRIKMTLAQVVTNQISGLLSRCEALAIDCHKAKFLQQEVESRTYHAMFSVLSLSNQEAHGNPVEGAIEAKIREKALKELKDCDAICLRHSKILWSLREDIEKARRLVKGGTFYSCVTSEERRQVYQAMAAQFNGTGHWYYCENGHPFAVGECGMPMEESRCPQCEAPVGGLNHEFAQGIRRADDMDVEFGGSLSLEADADW
ncbi:hypothetical protein BO79DRAFT_272852 [Aspergillus costaricaensis CBS 115574]|uniref:Uncharacterized protein n=1 Tax=Aspergillus costaricaensis CBS 115574 TaxID=1448317 RepID=A0ACD1I5T8_9EURO|nr:hypothetical protein BO79DRAFT_272852 [Aspergillus costaricaensis CBS 115574]RAK85590.1 hypothetical protein BO79DRAFT_272852 [Aspergillus costaricaensis CBS 115574]